MVNEIGSVTSLPVTASRQGQPALAPPVSGSARVIPMQPARMEAAASLSLYAQKIAQRSGQGEGMAEVAVEVRKADAALGLAGSLLDKIKDNLTQIVKQYPPFAQQSNERIELLNSISGLRKQLDALAFPPERKAQDAMPIPLYPEKSDVLMAILDPNKATDEEVRSALDEVQRLQEGVTNRREQMWKDVAQFVREPSVSQAEADLSALQRYVETSSLGGLGAGQRPSLAAAL
jgi:hypothetical protein